MLSSKFTTPGEEEHQSLFAAYDWRLTDQRRLIRQPCQTIGVKSQRNQHLEQGGEMMMMKNFNRHDSHGHQGSKHRELAQQAVHSQQRPHDFAHINTPRGAKRQQLHTSIQKFNVAIYTFSDHEELLPMISELF